MLPIMVIVRNAAREPGRSLQIIIGSMLVIGLLGLAVMFNTGMRSGLRSSADPRNVIVLASGSEESVERSEIDPAVPDLLAADLSVLRQPAGVPALSPEVVHHGLLELPGKADAEVPGTGHQVLARGVTRAALAVYEQVEIVEGHFPRSGEVLIGDALARSLGLDAEDLQVGGEIIFEEQRWRISGRMRAAGTIFEGELWVGLHDLMSATQREALSCVVVGLVNTQRHTKDAVRQFCFLRQDLLLEAVDAQTYYARMDAFYAPIRVMALITAVLIALGAAFGGLNTLYAAFAARERELATLQAIGFGRAGLFLSLLIEAGVATMLGSLLAAWALLALDGVQVRFSSTSFALLLEPAHVAWMLLAGVLLAGIGTLAPAWRCLAPPLARTLRS